MYTFLGSPVVSSHFQIIIMKDFTGTCLFIYLFFLPPRVIPTSKHFWRRQDGQFFLLSLSMVQSFRLAHRYFCFPLKGKRVKRSLMPYSKAGHTTVMHMETAEGLKSSHMLAQCRGTVPGTDMLQNVNLGLLWYDNTFEQQTEHVYFLCFAFPKAGRALFVCSVPVCTPGYTSPSHSFSAILLLIWDLPQ